MSREAASQSFFYADDGRLLRSVAADNSITVYSYYPHAGGQSPDIGGLLDNRWQNEPWGSGTTKRSFQLAAPPTPAGLQRPVMAEFEYQEFEGKILPAALTLYGYCEVKGGHRAPLKRDTVVIIKGVALRNPEQAMSDFSAWSFELMAGRTAAEIRYQHTVENIADLYSSAAVTERRYWGREKCQLVTVRTHRTDIDKGITKITLQSRTTDNPSDTVDLCQELRSAYNGQLLQKTEGAHQIRYAYDAFGRVIRETTFHSHPAQDDKPERTDKKLSDMQTRYEQMPGGVRLIIIDRAQHDARYRRVLLDGLQRVVRVEEQREPGEDLNDSNFCPVQDANGALDYLPGGLQRRVELTITPDRAKDWVWSGNDETDQPATTQTPAQFVRTQTLGDTKGPQVIHKHAQQNLSDGGVTRREYSELTADSATARSRWYETEETFDPLGRLSAIRTGMAPDSRVYTIGYDDLDRPVSWTGPDGTRIERAYHGMGTVVTRVEARSKEGNLSILGTQQLDAQSLLSARTVGKRQYLFAHENGQLHAQKSPDQTTLFSERSEDGMTLCRKAKTATGATSTLATFTYDPLQSAITSEHPTGGTRPIVATSSHTPWLYSEQRQVSSDQILSAGFYRSLLGDEYFSQYPSESQVMVWRDRLDRRTRVVRDHLEYRYCYNAFGQCERTSVKDFETGHALVLNHEFDGLGQEVCRQYVLDGAEVERYEQQWNTRGQLSKKTVVRDGNVSLSECFEYDARDRLKRWTVEEETPDGAAMNPTICHRPTDSSGKAIRSQDYEYDFINNLTRCKTVYTDSSTLTHEYGYSRDNPTQRTGIVTITGNDAGAVSRVEAELIYDTNGNLIQDDLGRKLTYTLTGRLASVATKNQTLITRYEYDEQDRLSLQWDERVGQSRTLIYSGDALCGEIWRDKDGKELKRVRLDEEAGMAVRVVVGGEVQTVFTLSDPQNGVSCELQSGSAATFDRRRVSYTPWGESRDAAQEALVGRLGYNNACRDPVTGSYHLGNGYRTYNPALRVFQQPDNDSPFGRGGLNDYAYCSGDPVNLYDPDGHVMISRWGQENLIRSLDKLVSDWTPAPDPPPEPKKSEGFWSLLSSIIWGGVAVLTGIAAVLLAIPTGGLSLAAAVGFLGLTVLATGLSIASVALQNSNPGLAAKLGWVGFGIDMAMIIPAAVSGAIRGGARLIRWAGSRVGRLATKVTTNIRAKGFANGMPYTQTSGLITGPKHGEAKYKIYIGGEKSDRLIVDSHGNFRDDSTKFFVPEQTHISFYAPKYKIAISGAKSFKPSVDGRPQFGRNRPNFDPAKSKKLIPDYNLAPLEHHWYAGTGFVKDSTLKMKHDTPALKLARDLRIEADIDLKYQHLAAKAKVDILRLTEGNTTFREVIEKILPNENINYKSIEGFFCRGKFNPDDSRTAVRIKHALKLDSWFRLD